jgi:hypothetical protein
LNHRIFDALKFHDSSTACDLQIILVIFLPSPGFAEPRTSPNGQNALAAFLSHGGVTCS